MLCTLFFYLSSKHLIGWKSRQISGDVGRDFQPIRSICDVFGMIFGTFLQRAKCIRSKLYHNLGLCLKCRLILLVLGTDVFWLAQYYTVVTWTPDVISAQSECVLMHSVWFLAIYSEEQMVQRAKCTIALLWSSTIVFWIVDSTQHWEDFNFH